MYKIQTTSSQLNMIKIKETAGHKAVGPKNPIIYTSCPTINILHVLYHINLFSWSAQQLVYICSSFPWKTSSSRAAVPTRALMRKQSSANFHQWPGCLCEKSSANFHQWEINMHPTFFLTDPAVGAADIQAEGEGNASAQQSIANYYSTATTSWLPLLFLSFISTRRGPCLKKQRVTWAGKCSRTTWYQ
jgi:hypothetical protein